MRYGTFAEWILVGRALELVMDALRFGVIVVPFDYLASHIILREGMI
jgi:hypothetical protein